MRIKENKQRNKNLLPAIVIILILIIVSSLLNKENVSDIDTKEKNITKNSDELRINTPTLIQNNFTIQKIVQEDIGLIQKDSIFSWSAKLSLCL